MKKLTACKNYRVVKSDGSKPHESTIFESKDLMKFAIIGHDKRNVAYEE